MKGFSKFRLGAGLPMLGIAVVLASMAAGAAAQTDQPRVYVEAPTQQIKKGDPDFQVNVLVDNVTNLAAFQFALAYDPSIIKYVSVEGGSFLGSTGREAQCLDPKVDSGNPEILHYNCVTLGPPVSVQGAKAGANGSGVLATVTFSPIGNGSTGLDLQEGRIIVAELDANGMPLEVTTTVENGALTVGSNGGGSSLVVPAIAGGAGAVAVVVVIGLVVFFVMRARARKPASISME